MFQSQCPVVHKHLLAGKCPWCGCAIINGQIASLPHTGFATAVGMLINMLQDAERRRDAIDFLGDVGSAAEAAVPVLTELLNDQNEDIRKAASEALEKITRKRFCEKIRLCEEMIFAEISARWRSEHAEPEPKDVLATDYLLAIIEDCGRHAVKAIPLLRAALKDHEWSVRFEAANALARIGPSAKEAIPELRLLLQDKDQLVRDAAEEAIKSIDE